MGQKYKKTAEKIAEKRYFSLDEATLFFTIFAHFLKHYYFI